MINIWGITYYTTRLHLWNGATHKIENLLQKPIKDTAILRFDYLLYLYTYSECHKSLYISEGIVLLILSSRRKLVTLIELSRFPPEVGQFSLVP